MNIYQRLNEVRKAIGYVQKDKKVQDKYMAVTHDAVTATVREHLIAFGVLIVPSLETMTVSNSGMTTGKGIPFIRLEAIYVVAFVNIDDPTDRVEQRVLSHALDEGDKAPGKALSYATKYAILKLLSLESGEEDEDRVQAKVANRIEREKTAITPTAGMLESLAADIQTVVMDTASEVQEAFDAGKLDAAMDILDEAGAKAWASTEAKGALWHTLNSTCRTAIIKERKARKAAQNDQTKAR
jgi:hypothetical protein